MIARDLLEAVPFLAPIGAGVALLWIIGRDRDDADEYTVDDYRPEPEMVEQARAVVRRLPSVPSYRVEILPPAPPGMLAPPGMRVPLTLYAEQVVAEQLRARYGTTNAGVIAGRMLREIGDVEQAKAGIRPRSVHWRSDSGECWIGCPICERDMTGAFPVVRAA